MNDVKDRFLKAVAEHKLTIVHDDDLSRHITLKKPGSFNNHFHITTWPGYLAISGDAGCYVFSRLPDMFEFFRGDGINAQYWGEKLQAIDRNGGYREFSAEKFHAAIKEDFKHWDFDSEDDRAKAWDELQASDLSEDHAPETINDAISQAMAYECPISGGRFTDFWDHNLEDYTFRYLWCCYAIQWAIGKYDAAKTVAPTLELSATARSAPGEAS